MADIAGLDAELMDARADHLRETNALHARGVMEALEAKNGKYHLELNKPSDYIRVHSDIVGLQDEVGLSLRLEIFR